MDKVVDNFNKLQWSKFIGQEQYVVRSSSMTEFMTLIWDVKAFIMEQGPKEAPREQKAEEAPPWEEAPSQKICPVHKVPMTQSISKKTGKPYFSHKDENGAMCFGKGSLPPLDKKYGTA